MYYGKQMLLSAVMLLIASVGLAAQGSSIGVDLNINTFKVNHVDCASPNNCDKSDNSFRLSYSYGINDNFSVEADYQEFGHTSVMIYQGNDVFPNNFHGELKAKAFDIFARGNLPLNKVVSLFGKVGVSLWHVDTNYTHVECVNGFDCSYDSGSDSASGTSIPYGVGIAIKWFEFGYTKYSGIGNKRKIFEADINQWSVGFHWHF